MTALHYKFPCEAETAAGVLPPTHRAPAAAPPMRRPTPFTLLYRWHAAAISGETPEITDAPQCGWFKRRLVKNGPWIPARIWLDQPTDELGELTGDETLRCEVNGREADPQEQWTWLAANPVSKAEYRFISATINWATQYAPGEPMANPTRPVDWAAIPTPRF